MQKEAQGTSHKKNSGNFMQGRPKFSELHAIRIRNFSGLYSPAFGPNMKR